MPKDAVTMIYDLIRDLSGAEEPRHLLNRILDAAVNMTGATTGSIILIDKPTSSLSIEAARGFTDRIIKETRLKVGEGITGWVAKKGRTLRVEDVRKDHRYVSLKEKIRSELAAPLVMDGEVIGVINLDSTHLAAFTKEHESAVETLATLSARVIADALIHDRLRRRSRQLETLVRIAGELAATFSAEKILAEVTAAARDLLDAKLAVVRLTDPRREHLEVAASHGASSTYSLERPIPIASSALGQVLLKKEPLIIEKISTDKRFLNRATAKREGLESVIAVPLVASGRSVGVLSVYRGRPGAFEEDAVVIATGLAGLAAAALENARLVKSVIESDERIRRDQMRAATSDVSAELAHEIRNPITIVRLLVGGPAQAETAAPQNRDADRDVILRELDRVDGLIARLIGKAQEQPKLYEPLDLDALMDEIVSVALVKADARNVAITREGRAGWTRGNREDLWQALSNVIDNAIDAARKKILVRAIPPAVSAEHDMLKLTVEDDGMGLPGDVPIFEPLVTTKKQGVGIGLFASRRIILEHGGEISAARSAALGGACFRVTLPSERSGR